MQLSEKEVEDFIYDDLTQNSGAALAYRGFKTVHWYCHDQDYVPKIKWIRQLNLGAYGILDIVGYFRLEGVIYVELLELKSNPICCEDFEQILRYERALYEYIPTLFKNPPRISITKYLIGTGFSTGHYLHRSLDLYVVEYKYDINGITFDSHRPFTTWSRSDKTKSYNFLKTIKNAEEIHGY